MKNTAEWAARLELAAAHRLAVEHGLNEGVWNHMSLNSPDDPENILISPGHTHWDLVTASNLALMAPNGEKLAGGPPPIRAGWIIHHPVHQARADAKCVIHVHAPYITAMSIRKDMVLETRSSQQAAAFHNDVAYYEVYDGALEDESEGQHMARCWRWGRRCATMAPWSSARVLGKPISMSINWNAPACTNCWRSAAAARCS